MIHSLPSSSPLTRDSSRWRALGGLCLVVAWMLVTLASSLSHAHHCCSHALHDESASHDVPTCCLELRQAHEAPSSHAPEHSHHHHAACCQPPVLAVNPWQQLHFSWRATTFLGVTWLNLSLPDSPVFEFDVPPRLRAKA